MGLFTKLFGTRSEREIKHIQPTINKILALEEEYKNLSEEALKGKTQAFKDRLAAGETLDDILPEAFAAIREAASGPARPGGLQGPRRPGSPGERRGLEVLR